MDKIIILAIIGIFIMWIAGTVIDMITTEVGKRWHFFWIKKQEEKAKRILKRKNKKKTEKFSKVYIGNPILEMLVKSYLIIIYGTLGAGKTLLANLLAKYLSDKYAIEDKQNKRYYKYMRPGYMEELKQLEEKEQLRVYSNLKLIENGRRSQELWEYVTQQKRAMYRGIYLWDEIGTYAGKDLYYDNDKYSPEVEGIVNSSRFNRQDRDIKWIATEHNKDNLFKPIRNREFAEIHALRTYVSISKLGKFKRKVLSFKNVILPGYFTLNAYQEFENCMFWTDKLKTALKMLLPAYCLMPKSYYIKKTKTNSKIKEKYSWFKIILDYYGHEFMFRFKKEQIFDYSTTAHESVYLKQFDKNGDRIHV